MKNFSRYWLKSNPVFKFSIIGIVCLLPACATLSGANDVTTYHFIRHAEMDGKNPDKPLVEKGRQRAITLIDHFNGHSISHIFATHTDRTYNTVEPLANARGIIIRQVPKQGEIIGGKTITNLSSGKLAIAPMIKKLKQVEQGSTTFVSANSGNLFAIMAGLGVPVSGESSCSENPGECLPCKTKKCFPGKEFNNIWTVNITPEGMLSWYNSKYGD